MANLPENSSYGPLQGSPTVPLAGKKASPGFKYSPSDTYQYLAQIRNRGATPQAQLTPPDQSSLQPGTPEYDNAKKASILNYGRLLNGGQGVPTETSFLPPADPNASIPIPSDYGQFVAPQTISTPQGENMSWGTPQTPVIKNMQGDVPGQYVEDTSNPNLLVKTVRGNDLGGVGDQAIHNGRPGFMYQIDHIMPLELGGADTLANRELLTSDQNDAKTKAQAVPYTLYAHGQISLSEARTMAMQWKNRDLTDLPEPNGIGLIPDTNGRLGIDIAKDVAARWTQPPKPSFKELIGQIPQKMNDLGKGFLPDPIREFVKGALSGASLGFLPYQQGQNEDITSKIAGIAGMALGGLGSFMVGGEILDAGLAAGGAAIGAFDMYRGAATAEAVAAGFGGAEAVAGATEGAAGLSEAANASKITFSSLNKAPGYISQLIKDPEALARMAKFGAQSVLVGQGQQFVQNKFNPYTLSGQRVETDAGVMNTIGTMFKDLAMGVTVGVLPPTIKGTAGAIMLPTALSFWANPNDPTSAITNGVIFGALHGMGSASNPEYMSGEPYKSPVVAAMNETVNRAMYSTLSNHSPDIFPAIKPGEPLPDFAHDPVKLQAAKAASLNNAVNTFLGKDANPDVKTQAVDALTKSSERIDKVLDNSKKPDTSLFDSLSKRKEDFATNKAQNKTLKQEFGKGYQGRNDLMGTDDPSSPNYITNVDGSMDLQGLFTEGKRITVATRQLYKGGLLEEMRGKADMDDLATYGKSLMAKQQNEAATKQSNYESMLGNIADPPSLTQAVGAVKNLFGKDSFNNESMAPSGKYSLNGDIVATGAGVSPINKANSDAYFDIKAGKYPGWSADPRAFLTLRKDLAPVFKLGNELTTPEEIKSGKYAIDPHPEYSIQVHNVVYNEKTGEAKVLPTGMVASDARLNTNFHEDHRAFNLDPMVVKGEMAPLTPENHKDTVGAFMEKNDLDHLIVNMDFRATKATRRSGQPFVLTNINDAAIDASIQLRDHLAQQPDVNPISKDIADIKSNMAGRQKVDAIAKMKAKVVDPASSLLPKVTPETPPTVAGPLTATTEIFSKGFEPALESADPNSLKAAFKKNFGMVLTDAQAQEVFANKDTMTVRDGVKMIVDAVNSGNTDAATLVKKEFLKTYLESGHLQASGNGAAALDMPIKGKMKLPDTNLIRNSSTRDTTQNVTNNNIPESSVNEPAAVSNPNNIEMSGNRLNSEPAGGLSDRIQKEYLNTNKSGGSVETVNKLANTFIPEGLSLLEDAKARGGGYQLPDYESVITGMQKRIQATLQKQNLPADIVSAVQEQVGSAMKNQSDFHSGNISTGLTPEDFFGKKIQNPSQYAGKNHPTTGEPVPTHIETPGSEIFNKLVNRDDGTVGPAVTPDEAAKYFKSKGYTFEDPRLQAMGTGKDVKISNLFDEEGNPTEALKELNKYIPKDVHNLEKPKLFANEFYKSINEGMNSEKPGAKYLAKSLDTILKSISKYGSDYANDPHLPAVLDSYFSNILAVDTNAQGKEMTQPRAVVEARGAGDKNAEFAGYKEREIQVLEDKGMTTEEAKTLLNKYGRIKKIPPELIPEAVKNNGMSDSEIASSGLEPGENGEGFSGMTVRNANQEQDMVHNLTPFEDLASALFSSTAKESPATASVRAATNLMTGVGGNEGLKSYLEKNLPGAKKGVRIPLPELEKEATGVDAQKTNPSEIKNLSDVIKKQIDSITKSITESKKKPYSETVGMMEQSLSDSLSKMKILQKMVTDAKTNPDEPLPVGLTPDLIKGGVSELMDKIKKINSLMKESDGSGGPGIHDGAGGPGIGGLFGAIWDKLKNGNTTTYTFPTKPKPGIDTKKFLNAIAQNETSVVKGDPYSTWQPSGNQKMGKALGKYRVTEASLKEHSPTYIGRPVTTKEFLSSPGIQDQYMTKMATTLSGQGYTPQQIADVHRSGTTLENGYNNPDYVNKFNSTYNSNPVSIPSPSSLVDLGK